MSDFKIVKLLGNAVVIDFPDSINYTGAYNGATAYITGDAVSYNGSSYVALGATTGNLPTDVAFWQLLAAQGATGATGPTGPAGANGTNGTNGADGADGQGVATGGTTGQVLAKASNTDYDTTWVNQGDYVLKSGDTMTGSLTLESPDAYLQNFIIKNDTGNVTSTGTRNILTGMTDSGNGSSILAQGRMNFVSSFAANGAQVFAPADNTFILAQINGTNVSLETSQPTTMIRAFIGGATNSGMSAGAFAASIAGYIGNGADGSSMTAGGIASEVFGSVADGSVGGQISANGELASTRAKVTDISSGVQASEVLSRAHGLASNGANITSAGVASVAEGTADDLSIINSYGVNSFNRSVVQGAGAIADSSGINSVLFANITGKNAKAESSGIGSFANVVVEDGDSFARNNGKASTLFGYVRNGGISENVGNANFLNARVEDPSSTILSQGDVNFINAYVRGAGTVNISGEASGFFGSENGTTTTINGKASFGFGSNLSINNDFATVFGQGIGSSGDKSVTFGWDSVVAAIINVDGLTLPNQAGTPGMAYFDSSGKFFSAGAQIGYHNTKRASWEYAYNAYGNNWNVNILEGYNIYVGGGGHTAILPSMGGDEGTRVTIKHMGNGALTIGTASSTIYATDPTPSIVLFRGQSATFVWSASAWALLNPNERKISAQKVSNYTINPADRFIEVTLNSPTITAHTAVSYKDAEYEVYNSGVGVVTIVGTAGQTFNGLASLTLLQYQYVKFRSNGANYMITGKV